MSSKYPVLVKAEQLERSVDEHRRAIDSCQIDLKRAKKELKGRNVSFVVAIMAALLLTSSCSLHARQLMGGLSIEELGKAWQTLLEGLITKAEVFGTGAGVAAKILLGIVNIPVTLIFMPAGLLRIIEEILEMTFPAGLKILPYIELALVLAALYIAIRSARPLVRGREARAKIRSAKARLHSEQKQYRDQSAQLASLKAGEEYCKAAKSWQEKIERCRQRVAEAIPTDMSVISFERYLRDDPEKTAAIAEFLNEYPKPEKLPFKLSPQREAGKDKSRYLDAFQYCFEGRDVTWFTQALRDIEQQKERREAEATEAAQTAQQRMAALELHLEQERLFRQALDSVTELTVLHVVMQAIDGDQSMMRLLDLKYAEPKRGRHMQGGSLGAEDKAARVDEIFEKAVLLLGGSDGEDDPMREALQEAKDWVVKEPTESGRAAYEELKALGAS